MILLPNLVKFSPRVQIQFECFTTCRRISCLILRTFNTLGRICLEEGRVYGRIEINFAFESELGGRRFVFRKLGLAHDFDLFFAWLLIQILYFLLLFNIQIAWFVKVAESRSRFYFLQRGRLITIIVAIF